MRAHGLVNKEKEDSVESEGGRGGLGGERGDGELGGEGGDGELSEGGDDELGGGRGGDECDGDVWGEGDDDNETGYLGTDLSLDIYTKRKKWEK